MPDASDDDRAALDEGMRAALAQLATCSHVPAAAWGPTGRSREAGESIGGRRPPGDHGHTVWAELYGPPFYVRLRFEHGQRLSRDARHIAKELGLIGQASTDAGRRAVLEAAKQELAHLRHAPGERPPGETEQERVERMLKETVGLTPEEVATTRFRMSARTVRRHRQAAGRDAQTGRPLPSHPRMRLNDRAARRDRAARLRDLMRRGYTVASAARLLGISVRTAHNDLKSD